MSATLISAKPHGLALMLGWRRVLLACGLAVGLWRLLIFGCPPASELGIHVLAIGLGAMLAFGLIEQWPRRLPAWLARWVLQVLGVAVAIPLATLAAFAWLPNAEGQPFWDVEHLRGCFTAINVAGLLVGPWVALGALVRQKEAFARHQALTFDLARSELERQALEARLHLLQAQVAPHFLFNTLANVQALVDAGSPQAPAVLRALTAYLRAAVPRLHEASTTLGQELDLAQAYLELMHMRMPDRLSYALHVDESARVLMCPPITLLTLVENAVRHGIDPAEDGGRIDIEVRRHDARCLLRVCDTGVGLRAANHGLGTGLWNLRERLRLVFAGQASLAVTELPPHGVCAELDLPAGTAST
ncbi:MAG: histidine kinase [Proteobacteria bacterium]|uniref:sensor histidine kinase n=1 Tax=Rudaea sp. TaxID=2136325 RepID=UPI001DD0FB57|nr:histidine kinase [Pseudomonadota bacterium]MBS0568475.1 histidine kinase [Pseudomonadota bacterium]